VGAEQAAAKRARTRRSVFMRIQIPPPLEGRFRRAANVFLFAARCYGSQMFDEAAVFERVSEIFETARYMKAMGVTLVRVGEGVCESVLTVRDDHLQQDGFVHAGVTAAMADHTAGGAAGTMTPEGHRVLTSEYGIHLLRPARGKDGKLVAKLTATLAIVSAASLVR
jgi:uncharacterized protein (TIGR00369 family)